MKCSAIFIAIVGAVSSNYAAAADHPNMNMLRGIIPAEEVREFYEEYIIMSCEEYLFAY